MEKMYLGGKRVSLGKSRLYGYRDATENIFMKVAKWL